MLSIASVPFVVFFWIQEQDGNVDKKGGRKREGGGEREEREERENVVKIKVEEVRQIWRVLYFISSPQMFKVK